MQVSSEQLHEQVRPSASTASITDNPVGKSGSSSSTRARSSVATTFEARHHHNAPAHRPADAKRRGASKGKGRRGKARTSSKTPDRCARAVDWAMKRGIMRSPDRYPGLMRNSSRQEFQQRLHQTSPASKCPDVHGRMTPSLPTFAAAIGMNATQLVTYRTLRKHSAAQLSGPTFARLDASAKAKRRQEQAALTAKALRRLLNATQWQLFLNQTAVLRRPPAVHVAASMAKSRPSA